MAKEIIEELQRTLGGQTSRYLRHVKINGVSIYYHDLDFREDFALFRLIFNPIDDISIPYTVAMIFYDDIYSIE